MLLAFRLLLCSFRRLLASDFLVRVHQTLLFRLRGHRSLEELLVGNQVVLLLFLLLMLMELVQKFGSLDDLEQRSSLTSDFILLPQLIDSLIKPKLSSLINHH